MAVMAEPRPESHKLVKYLVDVMPEALEFKSTEGYTPLALAFSLHRYQAAKILIDAGADQTTRLPSGSNILDILLTEPPSSRNYLDKKACLRPMLNLIDARLFPSLLTERTSVEPGALTPIAHAMQMLNQANSVINLATDVVAYILDFAAANNYECLELLDGSGDTPLHWAVKKQRADFVNVILERRSDLLYRENSVGRTALEMAEEACVANLVHEPSSLRDRARSITQSHVYTFVKGREHDRESWKMAKEIRDICRAVAAKHSRKRKLVSLLDANEVAKRLAKRHMARRFKKDSLGEDDGEEEKEQMSSEKDEVRNWYHMATKGNGIEEVEWERELDSMNV